MQTAEARSGGLESDERMRPAYRRRTPGSRARNARQPTSVARRRKPRESSVDGSDSLKSAPPAAAVPARKTRHGPDVKPGRSAQMTGETARARLRLIRDDAQGECEADTEAPPPLCVAAETSQEGRPDATRTTWKWKQAPAKKRMPMKAKRPENLNARGTSTNVLTAEAELPGSEGRTDAKENRTRNVCSPEDGGTRRTSTDVAKGMRRVDGLEDESARGMSTEESPSSDGLTEAQIRATVRSGSSRLSRQRELAGLDRQPWRWHDCPRSPSCHHCNSTKHCPQRHEPSRPATISDELPPSSGSGPSVGWTWDRFAASYCICLDGRADRLGASSEEMHRIGMCDAVRYYRPSKPSESRVRAMGFQRASAFGSWGSHRTVAAHALATRAFDSVTGAPQGDATVKKVNGVLVMEDDVSMASRLTPGRLAEIQDALARMPADWDILTLGHFPVPILFSAYPVRLLKEGWSIWRAETTMLHAYILSERGARKLAETPYHRYSSPIYGLGGREVREGFLDDYMRHHFNTYAIAPMVAVQTDSPSDQPISGKEFGIRLHARLARYLPMFLETLFMIVPFVASLLIILCLFWCALALAWRLLSRNRQPLSPPVPSSATFVVEPDVRQEILVS